MIKEVAKQKNSLYFEGMTSIRAIISSIDKNSSDRRILKIYYDKSKLSKIKKEIGYFKAVSEKYGFELVETDFGFLDEITLGNTHGGIVALTSDRTFPLLPSNENLIKKEGFYALIDGIEDPYNFGYAIRSLYACGCDGIVLGERNWYSAAGVVCRSSAGASELISCFTGDFEKTVLCFKKLGYTVVCADENTDNLLGLTALNRPILLVVGGEKRGVSAKILELCDIRVKIPYGREFKASLSAASATTMFAYDILRQSLE